MNSKLLAISKSTIIQSLEDELKITQRKYAYHKKISDGYLDLIQQTMRKLDEQRYVV